MPEQRRRIRGDHAKPRLDALKLWFDEQLKLIPGKSDLAGAIRYARSRWDALTRYVDDGRLEISNNAAENAIRPLKLGAKNWLFLGSDAGGERAAIFYTLIRSAKLNGVEPEAYLREVLTRIGEHPDQQDRRAAALEYRLDRRRKASPPDRASVKPLQLQPDG